MGRPLPANDPVRISSMAPGNPEPPKCVFLRFPFASDTVWQGNLGQMQQRKQFQSLRTIYYDATACASNVTIYFPATQQSMVLIAGKQGYRQVAADMNMDVRITGVSPDVLLLHLLNVDIPSRDWPDTSSSVPSSGVTFTGSPRLLGRFTAGPGAGEEIILGAPFSVTATPGTFTAQAAAQYNVMARRTAGAGAFEDSTRLQANIPGLELANAFTASNTWTPDTSRQTTMGSTAANILLNRFGGGQPTIVMQKAQGVLGAPTVVATGNSAASFGGQAYGGTAYVVSWGFAGVVIDAAPSDTQMKSLINVNVNNGSAVTPTVATFTGGGGLSMAGATDPGSGSIASSAIVKGGTFTFATLPAAATAGANARTAITDALAPAYLVALAGGGAVFSGALSTGAAWVSS